VNIDIRKEKMSVSNDDFKSSRPKLKKKRKSHEEASTNSEDSDESSVLLILNLTRPFTVNQLKGMLQRTGTIVDFWIDRIKSTCCVQFFTVDQASETRMALDGVVWPENNPKTLHVTFSTEEQLKKYQELSGEGFNKRTEIEAKVAVEVRDWDKGKVEQEEEKEERPAPETSEKKSKAVKCLDELFRITVAGPAIYWKPVSAKQIIQKSMATNNNVAKAQIKKDMMDTRRSLQNTKMLLPVKRRNRSSSSSSSN